MSLDTKPRVVLYVRVSTDKQEANNQIIQLREYASRSNYVVVQEYIDIISGKEESRPMFDVMFRHAHQRQFDICLFWDVSRFSRSGTLYTLQKLKELENLGIAWESYQEQYFRSAGVFKDVVLSILATIAKMEREKISERTKAGLIGKKEAHKDKFGNIKKGIGKRGKDSKPRKIRKDRGIKRGVIKNSYEQLTELRKKDEIQTDVY